MSAYDDAVKDPAVAAYLDAIYQAEQKKKAEKRSAKKERSAASKRESASAAMLLKNYGLDDLVPIVDKWIRGGMSWDEAQVQLYDTKSKAGKIFDKRFPAIRLRQEAGLAPISPEEYVNYERRSKQILTSAGMPPGFYDSNEDFTDLLTKDISLDELNTRVNAGFVAVAQAPQAVRDAFSKFFGPSGDAALASYFLDPAKAMPALEKVVAQAQVGGAASQFGFDLGLDKATQIADTGTTFDSARQAFGGLAELNPVFNESISETTDLTAEREGVDAAFSLDGGGAREAIQKRVDRRKADFSGGGGAATGQAGVFGLGSAR